MSIPTDNVQELPEVQEQHNDKEKNLALQRKMYERQLEAERKEKLEMARELESLRSQKHSKNVDDDDIDSDIRDPYIDQRALDKKLEKLTRGLEQSFEKKAEEKARAMLEQERQLNFMKQNPDFNTIMNDELLIQRFANTHPDMAEQLLEMPDNFARQKLVYQNIKALGLHKGPERQQSIQEVIDKNKRSPYYMPTSSGSAPPYAPQADFSPAGQKAVYEKMQEMISRKRG